MQLLPLCRGSLFSVGKEEELLLSSGTQFVLDAQVFVFCSKILCLFKVFVSVPVFVPALPVLLGLAGPGWGCSGAAAAGEPLSSMLLP